MRLKDRAYSYAATLNNPTLYQTQVIGMLAQENFANLH